MAKKMHSIRIESVEYQGDFAELSYRLKRNGRLYNCFILADDINCNWQLSGSTLNWLGQNKTACEGLE